MPPAVHRRGVHGDAARRIQVLANRASFEVESLPRLPYERFLMALSEAHLLVLLSRPEDRWLNAKIFDYLAVERRVLLFQRDAGPLSRLLEETSAGAAAETPDEVARLLSGLYDELQVGGDVEGHPVGVERFGRQGQAAQLASVLEPLIQGGRSRPLCR